MVNFIYIYANKDILIYPLNETLKYFVQGSNSIKKMIEQLYDQKKNKSIL